MKTIRSFLLPLALFLGVPGVFATPITFTAAGLKEKFIVTLEVSGKTVAGSFSSRPYGGKPTAAVPFTGKVIPTPKGKSGVFLEIRFAGPAPYSRPPEAKQLVWRLTILRHRAHLFIPIYERLINFEDRTPRWAVDELELEAAGPLR
ncbi:MAG TPA: hypothetical protein VJU77_17650 [Chthoniobacterales bacterium]|nr:hypothetical protein [Chthoniobacterales bacterium]